MAKINEKKYQNIILYFSQKLGGEIRGKKKLAKLLYFVDFDFFEKNERSITSDVYRALPMGPFPAKLDSVVRNLARDKKISIQQEEGRQGYYPTEVYKALEKSNTSIFSSEELKMLDRVLLKYGHLSGKQLEDLTHAEAPYIGTPPNQEIAYELSFYRGTDFSENA